MSGREAAIKPGNCLAIANVPVGSTVHALN